MTRLFFRAVVACLWFPIVVLWSGLLALFLGSGSERRYARHQMRDKH